MDLHRAFEHVMTAAARASRPLIACIGEHESDAAEFEWRVSFVAGMWFQELFNHDSRRAEMCIIPYATPDFGTPITSRLPNQPLRLRVLS